MHTFIQFKAYIHSIQWIFSVNSMDIQFNGYSSQWIFNSMHIQFNSMYIQFNAYSIQCIFNSMDIQFNAYSVQWIFISMHIQFNAYSIQYSTIHSTFNDSFKFRVSTKCEPESHASHASHPRQTLVSSPLPSFSLPSAVGSSHGCSLSYLSFRYHVFVRIHLFHRL